jgi:uncharacterized membrane protein YqiK
MEIFLIGLLGFLVAFVPLLFVLKIVLGVVLISERQVGVVVKRFSFKNLPPGRQVALNGEAGYQADTLAPGLHFGYWLWQFMVHKVPVTIIPQGEIGLIVAADGSPTPPHRILGKVVDAITSRMRVSS